MDFIKSAKPELAKKTQSLYSRELRYLYNAFETDNPLTLYENIVDIALEELTLDHITLDGLKSHKTLRLNVFRLLDDLFGDDDEMINSLILNERFTQN